MEKNTYTDILSLHSVYMYKNHKQASYIDYWGWGAGRGPHRNDEERAQLLILKRVCVF